jgi:DnaJ-class molecular chaperone
VTKDYYKTLGVAETASHDEIKKAYRKLAKKNHPDATGGDKSKEARFKDISEAYETLGDEKKRQQYDELRRNPFAGGGMPGGQPYGGAYAGGADVEEVLRRMRAEMGNQGRGGGGRSRVRVDMGGGDPFGGAGGPGGAGGDSWGAFFGDLFGGRASRGPAPAMKGDDILTRLEVELPEAALGAETEIMIDGKRLKVRIPAGVTTGKTIRLAGQGQPGARGAPNGDLLIEIHEKPHAIFRRREPGSPDIEVEMPVPVDTAILGGKADVRTLEGTTLKLTIPPGTSSGKKLRLRGKGAHQPGSKDARGDLYANVSIQVPSEIPDQAKDLITEFAKLTRR